MKLEEKFSDWLAEFSADGSAWQLSSVRDETFHVCWEKRWSIGRLPVVAIVAGWTNTAKDLHTAVINVKCFPLQITGGAEDEAVETVTVFYQDFRDHREAEAELMRWKSDHIVEDGGVPPESASLAVQTPPLTVNRIEGLNQQG